MNLIAFVTLWLAGNSVGVLLGACLASGAAFGLAWGSWPVVVANHAPGGAERFQTNMGITLWAVLAGSVLFPFVRTMLFKQGMEDPACEPDAIGQFHGMTCYDEVFM